MISKHIWQDNSYLRDRSSYYFQGKISEGRENNRIVKLLHDIVLEALHSTTILKFCGRISVTPATEEYFFLITKLR